MAHTCRPHSMLDSTLGIMAEHRAPVYITDLLPATHTAICPFLRASSPPVIGHSSSSPPTLD